MHHKTPPEMLTLASKLWIEGKTKREIALATGILVNQLSGLSFRHRDLFPKRSRAPASGLPLKGGAENNIPASGLALKGRAKSKPNPTAPAANPSDASGLPLKGIANQYVEKAAALKASQFQLPGGDIGLAKPLMDLERFECRWAVNAAGEGERHLFCGMMVVEGKSYCAEHHARAVTNDAQSLRRKQNWQQHQQTLKRSHRLALATGKA